MKRLFLLLLVLSALLAACGGKAAAPASPSPAAPPASSQPEAPPEPEPAPQPEPRTDFFPLPDEDAVKGITDETAVAALCDYLEEALTGEEYTWLDTGVTYAAPDLYHYAVIYSPDKAAVEEALKVYTGPYAPIAFIPCGYDRTQFEQAEQDLTDFLAQHPEIEVAKSEASDACIFVETVGESKALKTFAAEYPAAGIIRVHTQVPLSMRNPD